MELIKVIFPRANPRKQALDVRFNALIAEADSLFAQRKLGEAKNKYQEALKIKPNSNVVNSKITEIDSILKNEELGKIKQAKIDSLLNIALNYQNEKKFDSAILVYKNELLKDNPNAKNGLSFCKSQISSDKVNSERGNKQINLYKYLFFAAVILAVLLFFLVLIIYKRMDKYKSKYSEAKISLSENISNFRNTIVSFNSLLKSLGKEEEIVLKYNEVKTTR